MRIAHLFAGIVVFAACLSARPGRAAEDGPAGRKPLKDLVASLAGDDAAARKSAATALMAAADFDSIFEPPLSAHDAEKAAQHKQFRAELKPLVPALQTVLESGYEESCDTAAYVLAVLGTDARETEPALLKLVRSKDASVGVRMAAATALLHVTPRSRAVLPTLLEIYDAQGDSESETEEDPKRRAEYEEASAGIGATAVALTLANSGRAAIEAPSLVQLAAPKYRRGIRLTAMYALAELEGEVKAALPALRKLLADDDRRIRSAAGWTLLRVEGDAAHLPAVLKAMRLGEEAAAEFQESVAHYFDEKGKLVKSLRDDPQAIAELARQIDFDNPFYQRQAIRALGEIGPQAKSAIPDLITAMASSDKFTRDEARAALKKIDPSAGDGERGGDRDK
jgi:HEAT repeat protein